MKHTDLCRRTLEYAVAVAKYTKSFESEPALRHSAAQLTRASSSVAANYRAAGLARSRKEFIAKLGVVIEEADECHFWLEYLATLRSPAEPAAAQLADEAQQLLRIFVAARNTARKNQ